MSLKSHRNLYFIFILLLFASVSAHAQSYDTIRVATYNLLNYPGNNSATRNPEFRKSMHYLNPDILVVQEMVDTSGVNGFRNNVLNFGQPNTYSNAPFMNGPDTDNTLYYKSSLFTYIGQVVLHTALRDINGYTLRPVGISADSLDIHIYSCHLKSSQGFESERAAEADTLRNHLNSLPDGQYLITCGDMNLYTSTEPAYQELIGSQSDNSGRLYDPLNSPGSWNNSGSFASIHTQSTRLNGNGDGGATGGLDDRFDFILPTYNFQNLPGWQYVSGSYTELGNDGNHFNLSINDPPTNTAVPDSIADALFTGSDHLPVFMEIRRQLPNPSSITVTAPNGGEQWYLGQNQNILWNSTGLSGNIKIELNRTYPSASWEILFASIANDGTESWTVAGALSSTAQIRVTSVTTPSVADTSNQNFSILYPTLTLTSPNGGETWFTGSSQTFSWSSSQLTGNIRIELNRTFPSASWELLFGSAVNDGSEPWTATSPVSSTARIRITSVNVPTVGDTSNANFNITDPFVNLISPNGGEVWTYGELHAIQWSSGGISGNVRIDLNTGYPSLSWTTLFVSVPVANGTQSWNVLNGPSSTSRIRIISLASSSVGDTSQSNLSLLAPQIPPTILHDPHKDSVPGILTFTAKVTDDFAGFVTKLFYKPASIQNFDSLQLTATGNPNEYSASLSFSFGPYDYFIRSTDIFSLTASTDTSRFMVSELCTSILSYDDGTAERFNWSPDSQFMWAVKFSPTQSPFVLCGADIAVAAFHPDTDHQRIIVKVFDDDGSGGLPGTLLGQFTKGSIGNVIGGLNSSPTNSATTLFFDDIASPLSLNGDFYIAVQNLKSYNSEAFGLDTNSVLNGHSYYYDPCDNAWHNENSGLSNARNGNRMIRARGWVQTPTQLVIYPIGSNISLNWLANGSAYYKIYQSTSSDGPFSSYIGSSASTSFTVINPFAVDYKSFYVVVSSSVP